MVSERRAFAPLLVVPTVVVMAAVVAYPILYAVWLAFNSWSLRNAASGPVFVGLANFERLLADAAFWQSFATTLEYVVLSVAGELLAGFAVALALNRVSRGIGALRSIIMMPLFIVPVVVALIWRILLNQDFGPLYYVLNHFGVLDAKGTYGLSSSTWALPVIAVVSVWQVMPFIFLVLVAGMQSVPDEHYEAARLDGANAVQEFLYITLPWLKPLIVFVLLMRVMDAFKVFDLVVMLTGGGPGASTEVVGLYIYRQAFQYFDMGYAATLSLVMLAVIFVLSTLLLRVMRIEKNV